MAGTGFGTGPFGIEPFGSPELVIQANAMLSKPSLRVLLELSITTPAMRIATEDTPVPALGGAPFQRRLITSDVELAMTLTDQLRGFQRIESVSFDVSHTGSDLDIFFTADQRGKKVVAHIWDKETNEIIQNLFIGQIAAFTFGLRAASILATSIDAVLLEERAHKYRVSTAFAKAAEDALDRLVPLGAGIGKRLPGRCVKEFKSGGDPDRWDYAFGVGNLGIKAVWEGERRKLPGLDPTTGAQIYQRLHHTYVMSGKYFSAVTFPRRPTAPITVDAMRVYPDFDSHVEFEYKWNLDFSPDSTHSSFEDATPEGDIDDSDRVPGPCGYGIGAIQFPASPAAGTLVRIPTDATYRASSNNEACWEMEFYIDSATAVNGMMLVRGPSSIEHTTLGSARGWWLYLEITAGPTYKVQARVKDTGTDATLHSLNVTCLADRWNRVTLTWDLGSGSSKTIQLQLNEETGATGLATVTVGNNDTIHFDTTGANDDTLLGGGGVITGLLKGGRIGFVRYSRSIAIFTDRNAAYVNAAYRLMTRNPAFFLQEFLALYPSGTPNAASFTTAAADLAAVENGALTLDGFITDEVRVLDVISSLVLFRDLRLSRNASEEIQIAVAKAVTTVTATFDLGGQRNNIVAGSVQRTRSSLVEAVKTLAVEYRQKRSESGDVDGFVHRITSSVLSIGKEADPVQLPFVHADAAADVMRSFFRKQLLYRDELLTLTVNHEGRVLAPGQRVRINIAPSLVNADYQIAAVAHRAKTATVSLVPYNANLFVYDDAQSPPTPEEDGLSQTLVLGDLSRLEVTAPTGEDLLFSVFLEQQEEVVPTAVGASSALFTSYNGPSLIESIAETSTDYSDLDYADSGTIGPGGMAAHSFQWASPLFDAAGYRYQTLDLKIYTRMRYTAGVSGKVDCRGFVDIPDGLGGWTRYLSGPWRAVAFSYPGGDPPALNTNVIETLGGLFTLESITNNQFGVEVRNTDSSVNAVVRCSALWLRVIFKNETLDGVWSIKIWEFAGSDPGGVTPDDVPWKNGPESLSVQKKKPASGTYYYYAAVYDDAGRALQPLLTDSITL